MSKSQSARRKPATRRTRAPQAEIRAVPRALGSSHSSCPRPEDRAVGSQSTRVHSGTGLFCMLLSAIGALLVWGCTGGSTVPARPSLPSMDSTLVNDDEVDPGLTPAEVEDSDGTPADLTVYASPVPCCNPLSIDFTAELPSGLGVSGATRFEWNFGDGRNATGQTVNHTYAWAENYTVTITAYLSGGETTTEEFTLELGTTDPPPGPAPPDTVNPAEGPGAGTPTADAGQDQQVSPGDTVVLDGSGSRPVGAGPLSYTWAQVSGPTVALNGINSAVARFTAPEVEAGREGLVFQLTVAEPEGSAVDVVTVWVEQRAPEPVVAELQAYAGPDQTVAPGTVVQLDGSGSSAPATPPAQYLWSQVSGAAVFLTGAASSRASFVAPDLGPDGGALGFELRVSSGDAWDTDGVGVRISKSEVITPTAPEVYGFRVVFLSGPEGVAEPGPAEVSWNFVDAPGVSDVFLRLDCCECSDTDSPVLTSDAQGVYRTWIDVPADTTAWYYVHYRLNGNEYLSQSVYMNPPAGDPLAAPAPVIWYHSRVDDPAILREVIRSGVVTHIMISGRDRVSYEFDSPEVLEAIDIAREAGLKVIWSRWLWHAWEDFQDLEDTFDPDFYAAAVIQVQTEAAALGADYTAMDCECYGPSPLNDYLDAAIPEDNFIAMRAAVEQAAAEHQVDFVYPSGAFGGSTNPVHIYPLLGRIRVAEGTYYDIPQKLCWATAPFEILGAYVQPTTERHDNGHAPYYLPQDILRRRYLWSQRDGAAGVTNGLFLYPGLPDSVAWETATMLADAFDQD